MAEGLLGSRTQASSRTLCLNRDGVASTDRSILEGTEPLAGLGFPGPDGRREPERAPRGAGPAQDARRASASPASALARRRAAAADPPGPRGPLPGRETPGFSPPRPASSPGGGPGRSRPPVIRDAARARPREGLKGGRKGRGVEGGWRERRQRNRGEERRGDSHQGRGSGSQERNKEQRGPETPRELGKAGR
jgi:hypothetical protein